MRKIINISYVVFILLINCESNDSNNSNIVNLNKREKIIIKNSIDMILKDSSLFENSKGTFLVNPFFDNFDFNNFNHREKTNDEYFLKNNLRIFNKLKINQKEFDKIQMKVNDKYVNNFCNDLSDFSIGSESKIVLSFSGFNKKFIFLKITEYSEKITKEDLISKKLANKKIKFNDTFVIVLDGEDVDDVFFGGGVVYELL